MELDHDNAYYEAEGVQPEDEEYSKHCRFVFVRSLRLSPANGLPPFSVTSSGESSSQTSTLTWIVRIRLEYLGKSY
jgi:hypothetical protein